MSASTRWLLSVFAGLVALAATACAVAPASAAQYDVWSCRGPAGEPREMSAWKPFYNDDTKVGDFWVDQDCPTGGSFQMNMNIWDTGTDRPTFHMRFDLPEGASISGYRLYRAMATAPPDGPIYDYASAIREGIYPPYVDSGCKSSGIAPPFPCQNQGILSPSSWNDPSNEVDRSALNLNGLSAWIGCVGVQGCNPAGALTSVATYAFHQSKVTVEDPELPVVNGLDGTLTDSDPVWGRANISVEAADSISGIKSIDLDIDGDPAGAVTIDSGNCAIPFDTTRPCPSNIGKTFTIDTSTMTAGAHTASGTVTDAAGNATSFGPVAFTVEAPDPPDPPDPPGPPAPDNGVPAVTQPTLTLGSGTVFHQPGSAAAIEGRLTTSAGVPVVGAVLKARSTQLAVDESVPAVLPDATTGADGGFSIPVPGEGARQVEVSFSPTAGMAATVTSLVRVNSRLALALKARPKKVRIKKKATFTGRLTGAGPSATGAPVEIQAKVQGRWETVATVSAKADGTFKWGYRFRYVKRRALFSFRAVVRKVPGWPWPTVASKTVKVRITMGRR